MIKEPGNRNVLFLSGFLSRGIHYSQDSRGKGRLQRRIQNQIEHVGWSERLLLGSLHYFHPFDEHLNQRDNDGREHTSAHIQRPNLNRKFQVSERKSLASISYEPKPRSENNLSLLLTSYVKVVHNLIFFYLPGAKKYHITVQFQV